MSKGVTSVAERKPANRQFQDHVTSAQKKFAFNPPADRPFIEGITECPIAPWCQAIIAKALPLAIYVGRNLPFISGDCSDQPELPYLFENSRIDSCDWFLDLPGLLVLVESKARQPIEALRVDREGWLDSVAGSIGKGIKQLNRSHGHIEAIPAVNPEIDRTKPRVWLVVTRGLSESE